LSKFNGTRIYCGKWNTPEAEEKYQRVLAEWLEAKQPVGLKKSSVTIRTLVSEFLKHAETYYVKNGRVTKSYSGYLESVRVLLQLYGSVPVDEFGPLALETVQKK
jgi:hypothetical protein